MLDSVLHKGGMLDSVLHKGKPLRTSQIKGGKWHIWSTHVRLNSAAGGGVGRAVRAANAELGTVESAGSVRIAGRATAVPVEAGCPLRHYTLTQHEDGGRKRGRHLVARPVGDARV
eukprot:5042107-Pleurochrysis_carterae.AAC.5